MRHLEQKWVGLEICPVSRRPEANSQITNLEAVAMTHVGDLDSDVRLVLAFQHFVDSPTNHHVGHVHYHFICESSSSTGGKGPARREEEA